MSMLFRQRVGRFKVGLSLAAASLLSGGTVWAQVVPTVPDRVRDTAQEAKERVREGALEVREGVKEAARDTRDAVADAVRSFRADGYRSADIGLWFGRPTDKGLVISGLNERGAIAKIGFREGDVIVSVNDQRVAREADFMRAILADNVRNERLKIVVSREGKEQLLYLEPKAFVEELTYMDNDPLEHFGVILDDRHSDRLLVWRVVPRSPAYYAGIRAGDTLATYRGQKLTDAKEFARQIQETQPGTIAVEINRGDARRQIEVEIPRFEARTQRQLTYRQNLDEAREKREERRDERNEKLPQNPADAKPILNPPVKSPAPVDPTKPGLVPNRR